MMEHPLSAGLLHIEGWKFDYAHKHGSLRHRAVLERRWLSKVLFDLAVTDLVYAGEAIYLR